MSFSLTTAQVRAGAKNVTRRLGWWDVKPGDLLCAVVKGMGLKKGERVERICVIRVESARSERLDDLIRRPGYGLLEASREGFPHLTGKGFVEMFCAHNRCASETDVNRITFSYVK